MNAREARDIVKKWEESEGCPPDQDRNLGYADGYLASLEGPEVKALVDALERIRHIPDIPDFDSAPIEQVDAMCDEVDSALSQYREAVKK